MEPADQRAPEEEPPTSRLPALDDLVMDEQFALLSATWGVRPARTALSDVLGEARTRERDGRPVPRTDELFGAAGRVLAERRAGGLGHVVNATGTILSGNLGRAPLSRAARDAMVAAAGYSALGLDLETGRRASRSAHVGRLAAELCGTEAALLVNNGAAALLLVLTALAAHRDVIVSRGELVEVGATFRLPDLVPLSGARLCEVGTTNRTRVADYRSAIRDETGMLLKVHPSDYRFMGSVESASASELASVARDHGIPFVHDVGTGLMEPSEDPALASEPAVRQAIADGADLVVFSGDKLLGGPQAGIIAGRGDLVMRCRRHPLRRALRLDKVRRAAMEATLTSHLRADGPPQDVPVWAMIAVSPDVLASRAEKIRAPLPASRVKVVSSTALVGGGAGPGGELPSVALAIMTADVDGLLRRLRGATPPIVGRADQGMVLLDLRTIAPADDEVLSANLQQLLG